MATEDMHSVDEIKAKMEHVRVVGVTCLGINHPLLVNKKFDICIMDEAGQTTLPVCIFNSSIMFGYIMLATISKVGYKFNQYALLRLYTAIV